MKSLKKTLIFYFFKSIEAIENFVENGWKKYDEIKKERNKINQ